MRPFFPYYGSMWNRARHYPAPEHDVVKEPFAGSAGYSLFYDCRRVDLFDADPVVCGIWSFLMKVTATEIMALPELPEIGDSVDDHAIPQEAKWLIGLWLNRGSATPKKARTAYSARNDRAQLNWGRRAKERIAAQLPALAGWTITNASYAESGDDEATWLVDPPYEDKGKYYRVVPTDYGAIAEWVRARRGLVMVCEQEGADWLPFESLGSFKSSNGRSSEVIFMAGQKGDLLRL